MLAERLVQLYEEYRAPVGREQEILREINRIAGKAKPIRGTLVYKWVKNKAGRRYWYYLHIKEGGGTRSIYLGSQIPKHLAEGVEAGKRLRELETRLRSISRRRLEIEERLRRAIDILR